MVIRKGGNFSISERFTGKNNCARKNVSMSEMSKTKIYLLLIFMILLSGCKEAEQIAGDVQGIQKTSSDWQTIRDIFKQIQSLNLTGINISTQTFSPSVSGNVKVLEKFDGPILNVERLEIVGYKTLPKNSKINRIFRKYKEGKIIYEETEIIEPQTMQEVMRSSNFPAWLSTIILSLASLYFIFIKIRRIFKK